MGGLFCYILVGLVTFYSLKHHEVPAKWRLILSLIWPLWWLAVFVNEVFG